MNIAVPKNVGGSFFCLFCFVLNFSDSAMFGSNV